MGSTPSRFVITGASSGIGAEIARQLSARGAALALVARRRDKLEEIADQCRAAGAKVYVVQADVGIRDECARLIEESASALGGIDVVLLNAGISHHSRVDSWASPEVAETVLRVNYLGTVDCAWYPLPHLKRSRGAIAVVSSLQGKSASPDSPHTPAASTHL